MTEQPNPNAARSEAEDDKPKPWRIAGLAKKPTPTKGGDRPKLDWRKILSVALAGYLLTFLVVSLLDVTTAPKSIAYTEFQAQMAAQNIKSVYAKGDTIQGELRAA